MHNENHNHDEKNRFFRMTPVVDIIEENDKAIAYFEVPGSASGDVKLEVRDGILTVEAQSSLERRGMPVLYTRRFQIADSVEVEKISAKTENGVLTVTLPKSVHAQVHRITVE